MIVPPDAFEIIDSTPRVAASLNSSLTIGCTTNNVFERCSVAKVDGGVVADPMRRRQCDFEWIALAREVQITE